jgi:hypothetical protein
VAVAPSRDNRLWLALAAVLALGAILLAVALGTGGGGSSPPRQPQQTAVQPIPRGTNAQEQAQKIAAWLRARAAGP